MIPAHECEAAARDSAWRYACGEKPLSSQSLQDVLAFRRQNAPQHYAHPFRERQAQLRARLESLFAVYPDLTPDEIADASWQALDRFIEGHARIRRADG